MDSEQDNPQNDPEDISQRDCEQNFAAKAAEFAAGLRRLTAIPGTEQPPQRFPSPPRHYRARMEFALHRINAADGTTQFRYVMFDNEKRVQRLETSDVPLQAISRRMPPLLHFLEGEPALSRRLFQVNWRADPAGWVMLSLLYHGKRRPGKNPEQNADQTSQDQAWQEAAQRLQEALDLHSVLGRSKSRLLHAGPAHLDSRLTMENGQVLHIRQDDTCFTQPNAYTNPDMLNWARQHFPAQNTNPKQGPTQDPGPDLLELYCGIGNFTCALAPRFRRVLATEIVRQSIRLCRHNTEQNGLTNVTVARLSAAETAEALAGVRRFQRLADIDLDGYKLRHLLLDPPRSGLDEQCRHFAMHFPNILYISCNPQELLRDLAFWHEHGANYQITASAVFNQFPHTQHLEAAVVLQRDETTGRPFSQPPGPSPKSHYIEIYGDT
ncbi:hypothetical protein P0082_10120 [Candidatus Haliotispira prima]|uniref:Uncharacterized protein n=1 Tax=Candidatus Haliotispira prima TaxID=3034016 RepID=A0ABY8MJ29_9SPIO|nr:hypothetical protein P0082_10120 [Candidatus Haliotispira prima]